MKLWAFVGNETEISLDESQQNRREMLLDSATLFWSFKYILTNVNDVVEDADTGSQIIRLS